jgi:hypothetical protein
VGERLVTISSVAVRVDIPEVVPPSVDADAVRRVAGAFVAASDRLGVGAWRLGASAAGLSGELGWCGPASSAYLVSCGDLRAWLVNAVQAFDQAGTCCLDYADAVEQADAMARQAAASARRLEVELADLVAQAARVDAVRAAAPVSGPGALGLFTGEGTTDRTVQRLQEWADRLAVEARSVRASVEQVDAACRAADARLVAGLERVAAMTLAARERAAKTDAARGSLGAGRPPESGATGLIGGFFGGLRDDVLAPIGLLGGLVGLNGDLSDRWSSLGRGLGHGLTHPVDLLEAVVDWQDLQDGSWGHWLGTLGPGAAASVVSLGGYAALRAADSLALIDGSEAVLARVTALADLSASGRLPTSIVDHDTFYLTALSRGGGLLDHEVAGGHVLERHVGLTLQELRARLARFVSVRTASTFLDRADAERAISEVLGANSAEIDRWLVDRETPDKLALIMDLGRPVGVSVKEGKDPVIPNKVKVVLVKNMSALGFVIQTAFPLR